MRKVTEDKLSNRDFAFVERLLYDQKSHDTAIAELEAELTELLDNLLPSSTASFVDMSESKGEMISQPERWAIKRDENLRVKYLRGRIAERKRHKRAISEARTSLSDEENQLVWLKYDLCKSVRDCRRTMHYEKSKIYSMRQDVVHKVAKYLGLV
jgi:hypothetical protein